VCVTSSPFVQVTVPPALTDEVFGVNAVAAAATCWPVPRPAAQIGVVPGATDAGAVTLAAGAWVAELPPHAVTTVRTKPAAMPDRTEMRTADSPCV